MPTPEEPNPFTLGIWMPKYFAGRADVCRSFYERITSIFGGLPHEGRHFEFTGLPGIGRTSLLRFLADQGEGAACRFSKSLPKEFRPGGSFRLLPVLVEFESRPPEEHPFRFLWRRFLNTLKDKIEIDDLEDLQQAVDRDPAEAITCIQKMVGRLNQENQLCFLLLDDLDQALAQDSVSEFQAKRFAAWTNTNAMAIAGRTSLCENPKLLKDGTRPSSFLRALESQVLLPFSIDEARHCLLKRADDKPGILNEGDVERLYELTGGHPDLLIRSASVLWDIRKRVAPSGMGADPPEAPESWFRLELQAQTMGRLAEIADAAVTPSLIRALKAHRDSDRTDDENLSLLYPGVLSGVLSVDLKQEKTNFKLFSPLLEDYLSHSSTDSQASTHGRRADSDDLTHLSKTERKLYKYLQQHVGETCDYRNLWQNVWDADDADTKARRTIQVTVSRLRDKLTHANEIIEPVRTRGYRLLTVRS